MARRIPPVGPIDAPILIVGEAPGADEDQKGVPFCGKSGQELTRMLREAGINRSVCRLMNVFSIRPPGNDLGHYLPQTKTLATQRKAQQIGGRWVTPQGIEELQRFQQELSSLQPKVCIALGNAALWALTGEWGVGTWRGSLLWNEALSCRVIPTYHPAAILRQWTWRGIAIHDLRRAAREAEGRGPKEPEWEFVLRPGFEEVMGWLVDCVNMAHAARTHARAPQSPTAPGAGLPPMGGGIDAPRAATVADYVPPRPPWRRRTADAPRPHIHLSVDLETRAGHIACIGIATSASRAICIPFMQATSDPNADASHYWSLEQEVEIVRLLQKLLSHPAVAISGQNYHYDAQYTARHWGLVGNFAFDTMVAHHVLFAADVPKGLDTLASLYCDWYQYWKAEGKEWDPKKHDEERLWRYNCLDACRTWEVAEVLAGEISRQDLRQAFELQMWQWYPVLRMMLRGVKRDQAAANQMMMEAMNGVAERQEFINRAVGGELNVRSSPQMKKLFYEELGCKVVRNRKTGRPAVDDAALQKIGERDPVLQPLVYTIQEIRTLNTLLANFLSKGGDPDGRTRTSYNITGTETYRWSSSTNAFGGGVNLQNVTKGEKQKGGGRFTLPNLRRVFIPDRGCEIADVDLDRADVQIVAWDSGDEALKDKLRDKSRDLHTGNAADIFGVPYTQVTKFQRAFAKAFCHASNYGAGPRTVAITLGQPVREIEAAQARWFAAHPRIKEWHERVEEQLQRTRTVQNAFGYRRLFLDRVEGLLPQALAWLPQSSVAHIINIALCRMHDEHSDLLEVLMQVHDSLVFQYKRPLRERALAAARDCLEVEVPYSDPLVIPVGFQISGDSWGDVEDYEG